MKAQRIYDTDAPKKPVNLSANSDLMRIAKKAGINLSNTLEEAVLEKLRAMQEEEWFEENKEAVEAYNARVTKHGVFGAGKRRF